MSDEAQGSFQKDPAFDNGNASYTYEDALFEQKFSDRYKLIRNCNDFIAQLNEATSLSESDKQALLGEVRFLRAMKEYEWPGGCEDPRVVATDDGQYVMAFTAWNRKVPRLCIATSRDLIKWTKHGPAFAKAYNGRFKDMACKSGSMVTKIENGKQVLTKINGKYFMYWGENQVSAATSEDMVNWTPVLNEKNELAAVIKPREGFFDSALTECGPPSVLTDKGIVLLYNGKNKNDGTGDKRFTPGAYCAGQLLTDAKDPMKALQRLDVPFFRPMESFEKSGQYVDGTVFLEGLVFFQNKWFLYYGCADSKVSVAIYDPTAKTSGDAIPNK